MSVGTEPLRWPARQFGATEPWIPSPAYHVIIDGQRVGLVWQDRHWWRAYHPRSRCEALVPSMRCAVACVAKWEDTHTREEPDGPGSL